MKATLGPILMINNDMVPESWVFYLRVNHLKAQHFQKQRRALIVTRPYLIYLHAILLHATSFITHPSLSRLTRERSLHFNSSTLGGQPAYIP